MRELVVILPDFFSIPRDERSDAASAAQLPRLPQLETLLARAAHAPLPPGGWRGWLRERLGAAALGPAAAVARAWQLPLEPNRRYWLATPVHLFAGLDSVRLHPQGLLRLSADEQQRLVQDFARVFGEAPWQLLARDRRELLLAGPALAGSGADPATLLGADPSAGLPQGADAAALRRLASEIELWLHEHPVNVERQARAQLPISALWLWGAAGSASDGASAGADTAAPGALPRLAGEDTYAQALWQLRGAPADALPLVAEALEPMAALQGPGAVLLQRVCEPPGLRAALEQLESRWWPVVREALRARRLSGLQLLTAERVHSLPWWALVRLWRARRPWWELL